MTLFLEVINSLVSTQAIIKKFKTAEFTRNNIAGNPYWLKITGKEIWRMMFNGQINKFNKAD